jgi:ABC-type amino acid transport substrate-binding protein
MSVRGNGWVRLAVSLAVVAIVAAGCTSSGKTSSAAAGGSTAESHLDKILKSKKLRVGMTLKFKPQMYRDANNQPAGYDVELVKQMAKDLGVELVIDDQDFEGLVPGLLADKFDLISVGLVNTPERAKSMWFSKPYVPYKQVVVVSDKSGVTSIDQLNAKGRKITALVGSTAAEQAKRTFPNAQLQELEQQPALLEVSSGRADGVVLEEYLAAQFVKENRGKVHVLNPNQPFSLEYGCYALPKGDLVWQEWVNNWVDYWQAKGLLDALYKQIIGPASA